jgi:hypothetical protein
VVRCVPLAHVVWTRTVVQSTTLWRNGDVNVQASDEMISSVT